MFDNFSWSISGAATTKDMQTESSNYNRKSANRLQEFYVIPRKRISFYHEVNEL